MQKNIGFVSTRFAGTDGVTLEAGKWADVLGENGFSCFWFGGEVERHPKRSIQVPEAHFKHEQNLWIEERIWGKKFRKPAATDMIHALKSLLKVHLREFIEKFDIDLLLVENALTIPMHVPLGVAITELIAETNIPTIAHHHDFFWERTRYSVNAVGDYLRMAFPPHLNNIAHVVINSAAQEELAHRTGVASIIIPNVLDFDHPPEVDPARSEKVRQAIGLEPGDIMILQPTRVVQRKGIEYAIELVQELGNPRYKLVISHEAGDEGYEYAEWLKEDAKNTGVDLRLLNLRMGDPWNHDSDDDGEYKERYTLADIYPYADFITYPSLYEGFGNAFLEAIYFKKPMLINRYATFVRDIEPLGFDLVEMDGYLNRKIVGRVAEVIESGERREKMVETNYAIAARHYSYGVLRKRLGFLMNMFFGM